jgi:hypothetical protein
MPNLPNVYKTYQDVKKILVHWTTVLLAIISFLIIFVYLTSSQRSSIWNFIANLCKNNEWITALLSVIIVGFVGFIYHWISFVLINFIQIHDLIYDKIFIKWRERFDIELILLKLTDPFKTKLPRNFNDFAKKYRYEFMKPYYHFVGDGKPGIDQNTRIRFYERITMYWVTQLNEIFILLLLLITPTLILLRVPLSFDIFSFCVFILSLLFAMLLNRWLIRKTVIYAQQTTLDEIEEILKKTENRKYLEKEYLNLLATYKL